MGVSVHLHKLKYQNWTLCHLFSYNDAFLSFFYGTSRYRNQMYFTTMNVDPNT